MAIAMNCKSYILSCEHCGIREEMIFSRVPGLQGYRCRSDSERVFKARRGFFGDRPPDTCPVCGKKLKQSSGPLIRS